MGTRGCLRQMELDIMAVYGKSWMFMVDETIENHGCFWQLELDIMVVYGNSWMFMVDESYRELWRFMVDGIVDNGCKWEIDGLWQFKLQRIMDAYGKWNYR